LADHFRLERALAYSAGWRRWRHAVRLLSWAKAWSPLLAEGGRIDHDAPVAEYWRAFGGQRQSEITIRSRRGPPTYLDDSP
jgi:hypothetical protein